MFLPLALLSTSNALAVQSVGAGCAHATILSAVAASIPGETIAIRAGSHTAIDINVPHGLTFMPADASCNPDESVGGVFIENAGTNRLFTISGFMNVFFKNVTLRDGSAVDGGLILIETATVFIKDSKLSSGSASGLGGAVHVDGGSLFLVDEFDDNRIEHNSAVSGGAIYCENNGVVSVENGGFNRNTASNTGGAIALQGCRGSIRSRKHHGVWFFKNSATNNGGAIFMNLTGGFDYDIKPALGTTGTTEFDDNRSNEGGAIFASAPTTNTARPDFDIEGVDFIDNTADNNGGAVRLFDAIGDWTFTNVHMEGNFASNGGGAIAAQNGASSSNLEWLRVASSTFWGNTANFDGGGILALDMDLGLDIDDSDFSSNKSLMGAGGGIRVDDSIMVNVDGSTFTSNVAKSDGGAIHGEAAGLFRVETSLFYLNFADGGRGGGVFFDQTSTGVYPTFRLLDSTFESNTADTEGGGFFVVARKGSFPPTPSSIVDLSNLKVVGNGAPRGGGGLVGGGGYVDGGVDLLNAYTVPDCNAPTTTPRASATQFCNQYANNTISALVLDRVNGHIDQVAFSYNYAGSTPDAAALHVVGGSNVMVSNSQFDCNGSNPNQPTVIATNSSTTVDLESTTLADNSGPAVHWQAGTFGSLNQSIDQLNGGGSILDPTSNVSLACSNINSAMVGVPTLITPPLIDNTANLFVQSAGFLMGDGAGQCDQTQPTDYNLQLVPLSPSIDMCSPVLFPDNRPDLVQRLASGNFDQGAFESH